MSDDTPTLAQPNVVTAMGRAFVPFSIELDDDWVTLRSELSRLMGDARDVLDATKFLTGTGTNEPKDLLTGLGAGQNADTATTAVLALDDVYALLAAVPSRFRPNTTVAAAPIILDHIYRLVGTGDPDEPPLMPNREGPVLGRQKIEVSTMATTTAAGDIVAVAGDFQAGFLIADRIGMTVELVPHLFGASLRPTGQRGLFARWRTGSAVVNANAFRKLTIAAA